MTKICQKDERWGGVRIGNTWLKIEDWGCTICSCCMALEKLRESFCNPKNAAQYWRFNGRGEILWETDFNGMKFIWRGYRIDMDKIRDYANSPNRAVIVRVSGLGTPHWLYVDKVYGSRRKDLSVVDPLDGKYYEELPAKYNINGFALFERAEMTIPDWMKEFFEKAQSKGLKIADPLTDLTIPKLEEVLFDLGIIDKKEGSITVGRLAVILEKIKELW